MSITKKELFKLCDENHDAINELRLQSDSTDFVLATLIQQLKDGGIISELGAEPQPQLKQLDHSIFNGLHEKWRFAVIQNNGFALICTKLPFVAFGGSSWDWNGYSDVVGKGYDASNWQESLIERESKELTGSELVRAMLERGDRCVMCFVANNDANMFLATRPVVVHGCTDSGFISVSGCYSFAVAVNNQGEPLTQAEAGL